SHRQVLNCGQELTIVTYNEIGVKSFSVSGHHCVSLSTTALPIKPNSLAGNSLPANLHKFAKLVLQTVKLRHLVIAKVDVQFSYYLQRHKSQKGTNIGKHCYRFG